MNKDFKIHFLNTIWSDAIVIERNGHFAMIDTASAFYYPMVKEYLDNLNIKELDFILLTHFHSDHFGNILNLYNDYNIKKLYIKAYSNHEGSDGSGGVSNEEFLAKQKAIYDNILLESKKKSEETIILDEHPKNQTKLDEFGYIDFQGVKLELYDCINHLNNIYNDEKSPYYHQNIFSENGNSIGIFIRHNKHNIFLGADVMDSKSEIKEFNKNATRIVKKIYAKHRLKHIDVYKSCHHGGSSTNSLDLCKLLNADYCVITNTDKWLDNWSTRQNLKEANNNVTILQTDYNQYIFDFSKENIEYKAIPNTSLFITLNKD